MTDSLNSNSSSSFQKANGSLTKLPAYDKHNAQIWELAYVFQNYWLYNSSHNCQWNVDTVSSIEMSLD